MSDILKLHFTPTLRGTVNLPTSKSISNRVLMISALMPANERPLLESLSECDDTDAMQRAMQQYSGTVDIGAAGTAMRFGTAMYAVAPHSDVVLTGSERMRHRPIKVLTDALKSLGADIEYAGEDGFPPLHIKGKRLEGNMLHIPANISSQYISALLMIGPILPHGLTLSLEGEVISRPYINMTLDIMRSFGAEAAWEDGQTIIVSPRKYSRTEPFIVEADWSAASYWYSLVATTPDKNCRVELPHLWRDSVQGDSSVQEIFGNLGVKTEFTDSGIVLTKQEFRHTPLFTRDMGEQPDLAQTVAVCCALLGQPFSLNGLQTLRIKETDRLNALQNELRKIGIVTQVVGDEQLVWDGARCPAQDVPQIATYDDHRMAMAFTPAANRFDSIVIENPEVVSKSYPHFFNDISRLCQS